MILCWAGIAPFFSVQLYDMSPDSAITSVSDEKRFYTYRGGGTLPGLHAFLNGRNLRNEFTSSNVEKIRDAYDNGAVGYMDENIMLYGMLVYDFSCVGDIYLTDHYGLMDPFLSHLPA